MKNVLGSIGQTLDGKVRLSVLDARTKKVLRQLPWQKNMLTNYGMNSYVNGTYATGGWPKGFEKAVAGTGTTPTADDSGLTTATQTGTTVTLSGAGFTFTDTATDAGKSIKWDSGQEAMIVTVTGDTQAEVNVSQEVPDAAEFTIYRTNQSGLTTEVKRTGTWVTGVGYCGTTYVTPASVLLRRTFDFSEEAGPITYTEIGMSHTTTPGANLFSRILLAVPLSLIDGQQLRLQYELGVSYTPATPQARTAPITGWPVAPIADQDGFEGIESITSFVLVNTAGQGYTGTQYPGEPENPQFLAIMTTDQTLQTQPAIGGVALIGAQLYGYDVSSTASIMVKDTYVTNSFTITKYNIVPANMANSTSIRSIGLMVYTGARLWGIRFRFNLLQTKDNLHKLTIRYRWTWSRVLS